MTILDNYNLRINKIISNNRDILLNNPNIVAFGRGKKIINNKCSNLPCLTIYVEKKLPKLCLNPYNIIPQYFNGSLTDVIEMGGIPKIYRGEVRPALGGLSVGNSNNTSGGTITCALSEIGMQKNIYLLSCNHCLTRRNKELIYRGSIGDTILQPSIYHNGNLTTSKIAVLTDIAPIFSNWNAMPTSGSKLDAAIAYVGKNTKENQQILAPGITNGISLSGVKNLEFERFIYRIGAISGKQGGTIVSTGGVTKATEKFDSDFINILYEDVIIVDMRSNGGDSGSLGIVNTDSGFFGVAMLVAGINNISIFLSLHHVLDYFKLELLKPIY